jgi:hypothetical protein
MVHGDCRMVQRIRLPSSHSEIDCVGKVCQGFGEGSSGCVEALGPYGESETCERVLIAGNPCLRLMGLMSPLRSERSYMNRCQSQFRSLIAEHRYRQSVAAELCSCAPEPANPFPALETNHINTMHALTLLESTLLHTA